MTVRRIVVGLDTGPRTRAALEAAAHLAASMQAELVGLFVEDVELLHFAGLPFAREVGYPSASLRPLDVAAMERALRAAAEEVRRTLATVAAHGPLSWSFRTARGAVPDALRAAAAEGGIVVTCALRVALRAPIALLCSAALPPEQAASAAAALAVALGGTVEIVLLDGEGEAGEAWRRRARELLAADAPVRV